MEKLARWRQREWQKPREKSKLSRRVLSVFRVFRQTGVRHASGRWTREEESARKLEKRMRKRARVLGEGKEGKRTGSSCARRVERFSQNLFGAWSDNAASNCKSVLSRALIAQSDEITDTSLIYSCLQTHNIDSRLVFAVIFLSQLWSLFLCCCDLFHSVTCDCAVQLCEVWTLLKAITSSLFLFVIN